MLLLPLWENPIASLSGSAGIALKAPPTGITTELV